MFVFLRLGYCTQYNFFQFHQFAWKFCEFVFLYIQEKFYCLWILYLIICLSVNRINWLYYCKRSNSAQGSASISVVIYNGLWYLLGSMIVLSLAFWETSRLVSIVATLVSILPKFVNVSPSPHTCHYLYYWWWPFWLKETENWEGYGVEHTRRSWR